MKFLQRLTSKPVLISIGVIVLVVTLIFYLAQKSDASKSRSGLVEIDPAFSAYISAYTSGVISKESGVKIRLAENTKDSVKVNQASDNDYFDFKPGVSGKVYWLDQRTIEFRPDEKLKSGELYTCSFKLDKLLKIEEDKFKNFEFGFRVIPQFFEATYDGLKITNSNNPSAYTFQGNLATADVSDNQQVEKMLDANFNGEKLSVKWVHKDAKNHAFIIENIKRKSSTSSLILEFKGGAIEVNDNLTKQVTIPAIDEYTFMEVSVIQSPQQYTLLQFSDRISKTQNLEGLIRLGDLQDLQYVIDGNQIRVFTPIRQAGNLLLRISKGVQNKEGKKLSEDIEQELVFEQLKPAVKAIGKGVILPSSEGLIFPFEAVGLKSVEIKIVKIYENNVPQFLQVNGLDDDYEMVRVGRPAVKKTIQLNQTGVTDFNKWNRYTLDLAELIQAEPGAIYQVNIKFSKKDILFPCGNNKGEELASIEEEDNGKEEENYDNGRSYWDYYEDNYEEGEDRYDWDQRENPCNPAYYSGSEKTIKRNIFASDLGIVAKRGNNGSMFFAVTDIKTTKPIAGVTLDVYDFQQQLLSTITTDNDGMATLRLQRKPFLLIAKLGEQRGYLKLDDASSLSLSNFDISGSEIQKGVKGFIYGERGVWRPGDTLFLTFILEDKLKSIPKNYPVIFELINTSSQIKDRIVKISNEMGMYAFTTQTSADAPTGDWMAKVRVGGATFTKKIKIEAIKPNRLKIRLDFGKEKLTVNDRNLSGKLEVKWLHGAIAGGLKAKFELLLLKGITKFDKYPDYVFDDPGVEFASESKMIFDGKVDQEGNAVVKTNITIENQAPGALNAIFKGKVFEQGGDFSIDQFTIPYYPYEYFLGIRPPKGDKARGMLVTGTDHTIDIVAVDANGKPASSGTLKVEIYKMDWKWWWEEAASDAANYVNTSYNQPIQNFNIDPIDGKGSFKFRIDEPDWGRYYIRIKDSGSGHSTGKVVYVDWPGWAGRQQDMPGGASMLTFSADKEKYVTGDKIKINFPSSDAGRALISIENGSQVLEAFWVETKKDNTSFEFEAKSTMSPNCFVHVTLLQPHARKQNDLPVRLYGVIPVEVENPKTHLSPVLEMPQELRPEQNLTVKVSEENGKAMSYTLAMVDEGLLDLTRFKTPEPWGQFYMREALGVKTWDMYDYVIGAYGGQLERLLSIGGDDIIKAKDDNKLIRFKPVVRYLGPFYIDAGKSNSHTIKLPNYVGSVRTMVIAGYNGAYGNTEKTTPVKQPLMILATLPRVLGPEEELSLPVTVFAMDNNIRNVTVDVRSNKLLKLNGSSRQTISFNKQGDQVVYFPLTVASETGKATVAITAVSGNLKSTYEIELLVRNPNPPVVNIVETLINPAATWASTYAPVGINGTNKATLEISAIPPINLEQRLKYLIAYPHGCVEQTVSSAFPQLYLDNLLELSSEAKNKTSFNIKAAIDKLQGFQLSSGPFTYWPGNTYQDDWATCYAGHFLLEAAGKGYDVPDDMISKWKNYQKSSANNWSTSNQNNDFVQGYRLYTLALATAPEMGAMNRLKETPGLSLSASWRLAAAYLLAGQKEVAQSIIQNLELKPVDYTEPGQTYGSVTRDEAMILETLSMMDEQAKAASLVTSISASLNNNNFWMSTQTTAYSLIAISKFTGYSKKEKGLNFTYKLNNGKVISAASGLFYAQVNIPVNGKIEVVNKGKGALYTKLLLEGIPVTGDKTTEENNMKISVVYKTMTGEPINPASIKQGTDFMVEATVTNPGIKGDYKQLALTQIFPSGWEIINTRFDQTDGFYHLSKPDYQDYKDDRVYTYFDLKASESKTFRILLNASYQGRFYMPSIYCEAMYDRSINARKPGTWVDVINQQIP